MKTIKISVVTLLLLFVGSSGNLFAQTDSETSYHTVTLNVSKTNLLRVVGNASLTFGGAGAAEAGAAINTAGEDINTRIRMSSALQTGETRTITASIDKLPDPNGAVLYVTPMDPNASFQQTVTGTNPFGILAAKTQFVAALTDYNIVTSIRDICWTGTTDGDGYVLKYEMAANTNTFVPDVYTITYTLVDNP